MIFNLMRDIMCMMKVDSYRGCQIVGRQIIILLVNEEINKSM